jgi:glyoxylase-like metal-dependent hydrolase (beta-lactamase superfamily II)
VTHDVLRPVPDTGVGPVPVPGEPVVLAPGLVRLTAPNPGLMTGPGTNTYLIGSGELAVIDPGPADESHLAALLAAVEARGTLRSILVTHTHPDHAPGAAALAGATGARVVGFGPAENFAPDLCVRGGWTLTVPGPGDGDGDGEGEGADLTLEAVHTPGHASDHICWLLQESRTLLTGDHLMHGSTVVIRPPDGDLATYLASLALVRDFDPPIARLAPGHGRVMERVTEVVDALVAHRLGRHARVAGALGAVGEGTVDELLPLVYADVSEAQLPVARFSLWAHLRYLGEEGRAEPLDAEPGGDTLETRWRRIRDSA